MVVEALLICSVLRSAAANGRQVVFQIGVSGVDRHRKSRGQIKSGNRKWVLALGCVNET